VSLHVDGFELPESVLYDAATDLYYVSSMGAGSPRDRDDNGFITRVRPDGTIVDRWIDGATAEVQLDAPRGSAIVDGRFAVADQDVVRLFSLETGAPAGEWPVVGATMLNDVALHAETLYVSDTGLPPGVEPAGPHAVWAIDTRTGAVTALLRGPDLGRPNGLAFAGDALWVSTYGSGELFRLDAGQRTDVETLPKGALDGIVVLPGGELLVSSWEGEAIYRGKPGGPWTEAITGVAAAADIGFDTKRGRVLIPLVEANAIEIRTLTRR
jgi:sugar lactone lactonase YvrE